jgi:hypothetical protein
MCIESSNETEPKCELFSQGTLGLLYTINLVNKTQGSTFLSRILHKRYPLDLDVEFQKYEYEILFLDPKIVTKKAIRNLKFDIKNSRFNFY